MTKMRTRRLTSIVRPRTDLHLPLQSSWAHSSSAPYSAADGRGRGPGHPASRGSLVCHSHHSILHPEPQQQRLWPYASHKRCVVCIHHPLRCVSGRQWLGKRCSASSRSGQPPPRCHKTAASVFYLMVIVKIFILKKRLNLLRDCLGKGQ